MPVTAVMGLDAALVLITLVTSTALVPLTASLFAYVFFRRGAETLGARARPDGFPAQHGPDGGGDRWGITGDDVALFRPLSIPDLLVAAIAQAAGHKVERAASDDDHDRSRGKRARSGHAKIGEPTELTRHAGIA